VESSKLTGMIVTDLRKEIAEQCKEIACLKGERDRYKAVLEKICAYPKVCLPEGCRCARCIAEEVLQGTNESCVHVWTPINLSPGFDS